jgi:uncharacterized RDD family membrane protein YckC
MNNELIKEKQEYAGFWIRLGATILDSMFFMFVFLGTLYLFMGNDAFLFAQGKPLLSNYSDIQLNLYTFFYNIVPAILTIFFWIRYKGTPGKIILNIEVVNEEDGKALSIGRAFLRYIGYIVSIIPFGLGFFWMLFDNRNRTWHDMMAKSVVIYSKKK